ncbi:unnamed protein product [Brassica napus]|uniref:(rape) hypothetical protein n=1 Tax=Brassica napus TaxID=3708 RepID=A0A816MIS8_BRANA|nr:unnamed protein product [Brassica napus]
MANSFIILAELKNRDQSLQGRPIRSPSRSLSNFRYHLLATFDFKILVFCSLFFCCGIVLEDQRIDLLVLTLDAKNQNEPSETKPPLVHNLSHHFSSEDRNRGSFLRIFFRYLGSCCPYFWKTLNGCKCSRWQSRSL